MSANRSQVAILLATACLMQAQGAAVAGTRGLEPDDYYRIADVTDARLSPDGKRVAYLVTRNDREADEARTTLWVVGYDGQGSLELTHGPGSASAPQWRPDGQALSYLYSAPGSDDTQLMLLDLRGGEPRPLAKLAGSVSGYDWSPDGRTLVLAMREAQKDRDKLPIVIDARHFKQDYIGYLDKDFAQHLSLLDAGSGKLVPLTTGPGIVDSDARFSPDGRQVAFVREETHGKVEGETAIALVEPRAGAAVRELARIRTPNAQHLAWRPDGAALALLLGMSMDKYAYQQDKLGLLSLDGSLRAVPDTLDRTVATPEFEADGRGVLAIIEDDRVRYPARIDLATGKAERLLSGPVTVTEASAAAGHLAVLATDDHGPAEVHRLEGGKLAKISGQNDALMADLALGSVEDFDYESAKGVQVHALLVKPAGYVAGRKYPAILWIHGGPNGQDEHALPFDTYPLQLERQMLAAQGYVVLAVNYRGSSGRGLDWAKAILADWGHREVQDLRAGLDALVARGIADPAHLGIGGWSYGGILTDYTIASDARLKAAVAGAGSGNQLGMYGVDQYVMQYNAELGAPWKATDLWLKVSYPFFHADRIRTPTLFLGGEKDFNVPIAGGEQMYEALQTLGVPSELVVYPGEFHIFSRPSHIHDRAERVLVWYRRYLVGDAR